MEKSIASDEITDLTVRLVNAPDVALIQQYFGRSTSPIVIPPLTIPSQGPRAPWLRASIQQLRIDGWKGSATNLTAYKAGLFLINDFFTESHECSQSIEGQGVHQTGDYWHAILHRREPDYSNAKYWFRHVGRHPAFELITQRTQRRFQGLTQPLHAKLERWQSRLIGPGGWDPMTFVDVCAAAETDPQIHGWCELVQWDEMLSLLEVTVGELAG